MGSKRRMHCKNLPYTTFTANLKRKVWLAEKSCIPSLVKKRNVLLKWKLTRGNASQGGEGDSYEIRGTTSISKRTKNEGTRKIGQNSKRDGTDGKEEVFEGHG